MQVKKKREQKPLNIKLPNVLLLLIMAAIFIVMVLPNRARLSADTGSVGFDVIVNVIIVFAVMLSGGLAYHFGAKKVKADRP